MYVQNPPPLLFLLLSLSLSLSLHHRAATKRQEIWREKRERTLGKNSQKPEEEKTFVEKNECRCDIAVRACVSFFSFFCGAAGREFPSFSFFPLRKKKLRVFDLFLALLGGFVPLRLSTWVKETTRHKDSFFFQKKRRVPTSSVTSFIQKKDTHAHTVHTRTRRRRRKRKDAEREESERRL